MSATVGDKNNQGFKKQVVSSSLTSEQVLDKREAQKKERFVLKIHPDLWVFKYGDWYPELSKIVLSPGLNGVEENGNSAMARSMAMQQGWMVIDNENNRLKLNNGRYLARYKARNGFAYCFTFEFPEIYKNIVSWHSDEDEELAFLKDLKESYQLEIDFRVIDEQINDLKKSIARLKDSGHKNGMAKYVDRIKLAEDRLNLMQVKKNEIMQEQKPSPKKEKGVRIRSVDSE